MKNNIIQTVFENVQKLKEKSALVSDKNSKGEREHYSWIEFENKTKQLANALIRLGVERHENIAVFSQNMPQWTISDLAIMSIGAVTVPIYPTNTIEQAEYILNEAEIRFIFVGEEDQYNKALKLYSKENSKLIKIIVFDNSFNIEHENSIGFSNFINNTDSDFKAFDERNASIHEDDLATIIYTSGTTGEPKGVMLTHGNFMQAFKIHDTRLDNDHTDVSLAFLPLSHVFERTWTLYALYKGMTNHYLINPKEVTNVLPEIKPTVLCSVPRLYQKVHQTVFTQIEDGSNLKKKIFHWAMKIGKIQNDLKMANQKSGTFQSLKFKIADSLVLKKVRMVFGGKMRLMPTAGAPLSSEVTEFLHIVGLPIVIGYGLTETTASVSVFPDQDFVYGSVGVTLPEVEVKLGNENEILVKGKTVMKGYYKKPEETAKVFEGEWFKTGDAGEIDSNGNLTITDRIKDLMKTSGGKYIAPQLIEGILSNDQYIEQAILIADDKPYATALLVPNFEALKKYAHSLNLHFKDCTDLINLTKIREFYEHKLETIQKSLSNFEKVKKFKLLDKEFTMDMNELTPTLKIKRKVIIEKFMHLIEEMYQPA
jgi:long-chain acyl-CoA synthetase